eukprot:comp22145_c0_seq1/m.32430 comp22145_c0_seq1/g.32430  ORF comp22145_c0_seq1/g.32430 comp22145_c0_seq1/m.32430 type:complete len:238 (-) comp22145_c0_seq1:203-916(-)
MQFTKGGVEQEHILPPEELKKVREKEWEEARNRETTLPVHLKAENYDPRSLYERLEEQKAKKDDEFKEMISFKNQIKFLDDEELEFIRDKEREKEEKEVRTWEEEMESVRKYREELAKTGDDSAQAFNLGITKGVPKPGVPVDTKARKKPAIASLIKPKGASQVKRTASEQSNDAEKGSDDDQQPEKRPKTESEIPGKPLKPTAAPAKDPPKPPATAPNAPPLGSLLGDYGSDSDSD